CWPHDAGVDGEEPDGSTSEALSPESLARFDPVGDEIAVLEAESPVIIAPRWAAALSDGSLVGRLADASPGVVSEKETARYDVADGAAICDVAGYQCYEILLQVVSGTSMVEHQDVTLDEELGDAVHTWRLHVGPSFSDVGSESPYYQEIEVLLHHAAVLPEEFGQERSFEPDGGVERHLMARWIARAVAAEAGETIPDSIEIGGETYACCPGGGEPCDPSTPTYFCDVPADHESCAFAHYLAAKGIASGATAPEVCQERPFLPGDTATRRQAAAWLAQSLSSGEVPESYSDPETGREYRCGSDSPLPPFDDVPASNSFCSVIGYLWARGIDDEQACDNPEHERCFSPASPVLRQSLARFIAGGFRLELYAP